MDALSRGFRRDAKEVYRRLRTATASGNTLTVSKPLLMGAVKPETISVSEVIGGQFLVGEPDIVRRIRIEQERLSAIDFGRDPDDVFEALASVPPSQITKLKTFHQDATRGLAAIYSRMQAAHQFLSAENVIALDRWGQHELCEFHFRVQRAQGSITVSFGVKSGYDWYAKIRFNEPVMPPP